MNLLIANSPNATAVTAGSQSQRGAKTRGYGIPLFTDKIYREF
jgi:hypothetical protein